MKDQEMLEAAFEQFNTVSSQLIEAYRQLEVQVNVLNAQLDEANNQLRKQRDENAELAERLGMLLEALPAGVVQLSANGLVVAENPAAQLLLQGEHAGQAWDAVMAGWTSSEMDGTYTLPAQQGACRLALQYQDLPASGGRIVLLHDVSRLHHLTVELAHQQKLAAMGGMAASLAHQLRTPLATAMLYTANLKQEGLRPEDRARFVDKSLARMKALEGLIQNMLGFVRGQTSALEPLDVAALVEDVSGILIPQCHERGMIWDCNIQLPSAITVMGDRKALQGALVNLLENAMQFSPEGGRIGLLVYLQEGKVCFRVEDDGTGLNGIDPARLFEPFFTTRTGGTGLGLSIVKKVAEELSGVIVGGDRLVGGAYFELSLPCCESSTGLADA
ncbi:MAG: HAMP domain-containing histidine kinase [Aquitalea sp.]|nr:HAMP domain-containing histidine kinase [Aquitalea sp.]